MHEVNLCEDPYCPQMMIEFRHYHSELVMTAMTLETARSRFGSEYVERRQAQHEALVAKVKPTP